MLVVDDFASFRSTLMGMLSRLGVHKIEEATRSQEVIKWCKEREFDVILCDYNLGSGRNGQHVLEELRFKNLIQKHNLFLMVTAEASKEMVLSAYDCEPDDYLMKPLNLKVLEQRLTRLVQQRNVLLPVYKLLESEDKTGAIAKLEAVVKEPGRHNLIAQKLLGQLYLENEQHKEAQRLYLNNLQDRKLDWAQLGLARVALACGEENKAQQMLQTLVAESRLFLPARDALMKVYEQKQDFDALLDCVHEAVELSPRSLFRQRKLARLAMDHGEVKQALEASLEAMKLGEPSCHRSSKDDLMFLTAAGNALEVGVDCGHIDIRGETKKCIAKLNADDNVTADVRLQGQLLNARIHALSGDEAKAKTLAEEGLKQIGVGQVDDVDVAMAQHAYLVSVNELPAAHALADQIIAQHGEGAVHGEQLDKLMPEPASERNRRRVAQLNKAGIELYNAAAYEQALDYFRRAILLFPRHVGLQLNYLQTLLGLAKQDGSSSVLGDQIKAQVERLKLLISDTTHPQYTRLMQLINNSKGLG